VDRCKVIPLAFTLSSALPQTSNKNLKQKGVNLKKEGEQDPKAAI
jgi:hypothetical protein